MRIIKYSSPSSLPTIRGAADHSRTGIITINIITSIPVISNNNKEEVIIIVEINPNLKVIFLINLKGINNTLNNNNSITPLNNLLSIVTSLHRTTNGKVIPFAKLKPNFNLTP